jgi:hypothetical protein
MSQGVAWLLGWMLLAAIDRLCAQTVAALRSLDPTTPIKQRLDDLILRVTAAEKIHQISDKWGSRSVPRLHRPSILQAEGLPIPVPPGAGSYPFSQSPLSGKVRLHAHLGIQSGGVGPVLQTLTIGGQTLATRDDWDSSSVSRNASHRGL